ncbi:MAG: type II toxin-antitoxin system RelE/ParE family toxin [Proteobacteria bacterium]|nr:type II toxin-antitoxin system RelE/ParE family toxin [Pseudomonadota bacterium]NOG59165.1 type II toxin-antitoxin system RelE/ParE family toxin [Pseudomonadota bacterium]
MDYQVTWSPEAVEDIEEIARYIEKDSPSYAQAVIEQIIDASRQLNQLPLRGRVVPELEDEAYRELFIYSYRLIYRVKDKQVIILAIIHGRRLLEKVEGRLLEN